jgi:hypothetical protein
MSCYEWEHGSIKLPAGAMKAVREAVVKAYNDSQERVFELAQRVFVSVKAANKGKRNVKWRVAVEDEAARLSRDGGESTWKVVHLVMPEYARPLPTVGHGPQWERVQATKPSAPKRKNLKLLPKRVERVDMGDATIVFKEDGRTVEWIVSENNHAVEHARATPIGRAFFAALARIEWKRGSGGEIVGNDEYNRDNRHEGGGGNYVKETFGPKTKAEKKALGFSRYY